METTKPDVEQAPRLRVVPWLVGAFVVVVVVVLLWSVGGIDT